MRQMWKKDQTTPVDLIKKCYVYIYIYVGVTKEIAAGIPVTFSLINRKLDDKFVRTSSVLSSLQEDFVLHLQNGARVETRRSNYRTKQLFQDCEL